MLYQCLSGRLPYDHLRYRADSVDRQRYVSAVAQKYGLTSTRRLRDRRARNGTCAKRSLSHRRRVRMRALHLCQQRLQRKYENELSEPLTPSPLIAKVRANLATLRTVPPDDESGVRQRDGKLPQHQLPTPPYAALGLVLSGSVWPSRCGPIANRQAAAEHVRQSWSKPKLRPRTRRDLSRQAHGYAK